MRPVKQLKCFTLFITVIYDFYQLLIFHWHFFIYVILLCLHFCWSKPSLIFLLGYISCCTLQIITDGGLKGGIIVIDSLTYIYILTVIVPHDMKASGGLTLLCFQMKERTEDGKRWIRGVRVGEYSSKFLHRYGCI